MRYDLTTIKPASPSALSVSMKPRSKEGEAEKPEVFVIYDLLPGMAEITNPTIAGFVSRAVSAAMQGLLREAIKAGKDYVEVSSLDDLFIATKREFLITKPDLLAWLNDYALPIVAAAISIKAGLALDSVKVVKKVIAYREEMSLIASRQIMSQEQIDSALRVLDLVCQSGVANDYTDNVVTAIARKQEKLNDWLKNGESDDDSDPIDF